MTAVNLETVRGAVEILRHVKKQEARLKELKSAARAEVEAAMGNQTVGILDGHMAIEIRRTKKNQFRQNQFTTAHPEIAAEFTDLQEVESFHVCDPEPKDDGQ